LGILQSIEGAYHLRSFYLVVIGIVALQNCIDGCTQNIIETIKKLEHTYLNELG
jgi:hypothetical protein